MRDVRVDVLAERDLARKVRDAARAIELHIGEVGAVRHSRPPNASPELLPEAGARDERSLEAVSSRPLLGAVDRPFIEHICKILRRRPDPRPGFHIRTTEGDNLLIITKTESLAIDLSKLLECVVAVSVG
jgi:hypothetical protein